MIDVPILVKDALKDGRRKKNYRILVLNDDGTTDFVIDNNTLVSEQADIDERMCSGDTIKFGLCEGSSFQFQYFDHPNITDRQIQVFIDAQYIGTGYENVQKFQRYSFITLEEGGNYRAYSANANGFSKLYLLRNGSTQQLTPTSTDTETYVEVSGMVGDMLEVEWTQFPLYDTYLQKQTPDMLLEYPIPMGFFTVKNCSRQAITGIIKATAYNKLMSEYLDQKANDLLLDVIPDSGPDKTTLFNLQQSLLNNYGIIEINTSDVDIEIDTDSHIRTAVELATNAKIIGDNRNRVLTIVRQPFKFDFDGDARNPSYIEMRPEINDFIIGLQDAYDKLKVSIRASMQSPEALLDAIIPKLYECFGIEIVSTTDDPNINAIRYYTLPEICEHAQASTTNMEFYSIYDLKNVSYAWSMSLFYPEKMDATYAPGTSSYDYKLIYTWDADKAVQDAESLQGKFKTALMSSLSDAERITFDISDPNAIPDFTLRDIMTASYETVCQFGKLDRVTDLFAGVELNESRLLPQIDLYPDTTLYPAGAQSSSFKSMYSKLWADEGNVQKWRNLIITYKGLDENNQEKEFTLQRQINADGTQDYNMSDNWLFKNLTWTSQKVGDYADAMVAKMRDITWFPFEMWCAGIPYLETGDEIEITVNQSTYTSYVLQRQLKGIQNLQDTFINGTLDIF